VDPASKPAAALYVIATPLGNLGDISARARAVLAAADVVACEDTRVTRKLYGLLGLASPRLVRCDDHTMALTAPDLIEAVRGGKIVALVSDAGTPLIADPGYRLVHAMREAGLPVTAVPGPSAAIAALSISGLPCERFMVTGFLPAKAGARARALVELKTVPATLVVFEAPHRLPESLAAMAEVLGPRQAAVARELTKLFEEVRGGTLDDLARHYAAAGPPKGEVVVVIGPPAAEQAASGDDVDAKLDDALAQMSVRDAAAAVAIATGLPRRQVYARALARAKRPSGSLRRVSAR
jgi:16S rRNA (cytidine1402-2'-O)-methyltransferase